MKIKVCGMRDGENIRQVASLGIDWIGMVFAPGSPRCVTMIPTNAGIIPDRGKEVLKCPDHGEGCADGANHSPGLVGVFADEMAQNIITRVVNFSLNAVQLDGSEPPTLIRNLRSTLTAPSAQGRAIAPGLQIWKKISVGSADDLSLCDAYVDCCDMFVFEVKGTVDGDGRQHRAWDLLQAYDGPLPFLLSGSMGPADAAPLRTFHHPLCEGANLDEAFETAPAMKDAERLRSFIASLGTVPKGGFH